MGRWKLGSPTPQLGRPCPSFALGSLPLPQLTGFPIERFGPRPLQCSHSRRVQARGLRAERTPQAADLAGSGGRTPEGRDLAKLGVGWAPNFLPTLAAKASPRRHAPKGAAFPRGSRSGALPTPGGGAPLGSRAAPPPAHTSRRRRGSVVIPRISAPSQKPRHPAARGDGDISHQAHGGPSRSLGAKPKRPSP